MSAKVVVPVRIISQAASRVPQVTNSGVTWAFSAGQMYFVSQTMSSTSSATPRRRVMGTWVWVFTSPGITMRPVASIVFAGAKRARSSAAVPTATMRSPRTATAPSSTTRKPASMVTTVPPATSRSTLSAAARETAGVMSSAAPSAAAKQVGEECGWKRGGVVAWAAQYYRLRA